MKNIFKRFTAVFCMGLLLTSIIIPSVHAEETDTALTLPSGMTIEQVQKNLSEKINQFTIAGEQSGFASAVVGIFQGDEVLYSGYFGEIDMENHVPADENSVYEWGSISKTLIWVSAMQLWEQGKLDLNRDVREYLPDGFFQHLSYDNMPITMLNLMNHNAGWQETTKPIFKSDENAILSLSEELQLIEPEQVNPPGKISAYSNYGAAVAGYVIECISGQDYCDYVHENIFEPLGMEHTALNPTHSDNAWVYEQRKKTKSYRFTLNCVSLGNKLDYIPGYPAGSATGTLSDLMTYAQALVNDDAPLFQNPETQKMMYTGTDFYGESDIPMCAHGFWCTEYAVRTYGHTGATTAGQANMLFDLDSKTGLVLMVNEPDGNFMLSDMPALVFGALPADKYNFREPKKEEDLNGYYLSARSTHSGMLKFIPYLSAMSARTFSDSESIGREVNQLKIKGQLENNAETAVLFGKQYTPDNKLIKLQLPSMDLIPCQFYFLKLSLFTVYILLAVVSVYLLLIRRKLKKHNRWTAYKGSAVITSGHVAKIVSVLVLLMTYVVYINNNGGISVASGTVFGIMQMLCIVICGVSAVTSCVSVMVHKKAKLLNIMNTIGCGLSVIAILYFEMYRFWVC